MKNRIILSLIYLSTLPILSFGQQSAAVASRTTDALQILETQRGEVEFFKTLVYRFEIAWEESDFQSMSDLRNGLVKLMALEVKQLSAKAKPSKVEIDRLEAEKDNLNKLEAATLSLNDAAFGKKAEENKKLFNDFIRLMEDDFAAQAKATRQPEKQ